MSTLLDATAGVDVADRAVKAALDAGADGAQVVHVFDELFEVTYDNNDINMIRTTVDDTVAMTVYVNGAKGQSQITGRSNDLIDQAVAEAVASARAGVSDPANALVEGEPTSLREVGDREPQQEAMLDAISPAPTWRLRPGMTPSARPTVGTRAKISTARSDSQAPVKGRA